MLGSQSYFRNNLLHLRVSLSCGIVLGAIIFYSRTIETWSHLSPLFLVCEQPVTVITARLSLQGSVSGRIQCTLAAQSKSGEDTMTKEEAVKETPKEIFLKDYKAPDYAFEKVIFFPNWSFSFFFFPCSVIFCSALSSFSNRYSYSYTGFLFCRSALQKRATIA